MRELNETLAAWQAHPELDLPERTAKGYAALGVMEQHLAHHRFFVGDRYGLADIALYAYTHVAHLSGYDLAAFPAVRAWLARVAAEPRHVTMDFNPTAAMPAL